ncbi:MAG: iron ABC transporter permease [Bifidobacteriaceae bacterium]|nr:iron ABC transporter permease [Bifidobacteriaceae bacterium]
MVLGGARRTRVVVFFAITAVLAVALLVLSAGIGQFALTPGEVVGSILHKIGLPFGPVSAHPNADDVLWSVRFPRVTMALLVGAGLATAGAVMQGVFGNPLAEPGVIGVSAGAAVAACAVIATGWASAWPWSPAAAAFAGGLATTLTVYVLARSGGRTEVVTLVLTGIAVNAVCGAGIAFLTFVATRQAREQIVFWQLGSLNGTRWSYVAIIAPLVGVGVAAALGLGRKLDLLCLGERAARHLGVRVERLRIVAIGVIALLAAGAVAFCGIISFVGLVVPHLVRMVLGPAHRLLIAGSVLGGGALMLGADLIARNAVPYADLPIGMLTALVGGPFFFWLLRRTRRTSGGWA